MKMYDMVKRLRGFGFEVEKEYFADTSTYEFTLTKGSNRMTGLFEYRPFESPTTRHERQLRFVDDLVRRFEEDFGKIPESEFKLNDKIIVTKGLFTGARGIVIASVPSLQCPGKQRYQLKLPNLHGCLKGMHYTNPFFEEYELMLADDHDAFDVLAYEERDVENTYKLMVNSLYGCNGPFMHIPQIKNVIFNPPATIVFWSDDTKTVVKCQDYEDTFDPEKGLAMAISKKAMGNKGNYYNTIDKWVNKYYEEVEPLYPSFPKIDDSWWEKARTDVTRLQEFIDKRLGSKVTHGSDCEPVADQEAMLSEDDQ